MATVFDLTAYTLDGDPVGDPHRRYTSLPIRIGRNTLNDFAVVHPAISGFHARIEDIDGRICVVDLGSKNGVHLPSHGGAPQPIPANQPTDLAPCGYQFFLGAHIRVELQFDEARDALAHRTNAFAVGNVLGNRDVLLESAAHAPAPPPPLHAPPQAAGAFLPAAAPVQHLEGAAPMLETRALEMSIDVMALQGLRELAASIVPGVSLDSSGDVARFITKLHDTLEVFCRSFIPLRDGYLQFVSSLDLQQRNMRTQVRSASYRAVEAAQTPAAVATALMNPKDRSFDAPNAVEGILADLMLHQLALLEGVMSGVRALLEELSPENIERQAGGHLPLGRHKALWQAYCRVFDDLSEERQTFSRIFGPDFTSAYRQYRSEKPGGGTRA